MSKPVVLTTFHDWAKIELAKISDMNKEQMIQHFPHKKQENLFRMWQSEVTEFIREREREREHQPVTKSYSKWSNANPALIPRHHIENTVGNVAHE